MKFILRNLCIYILQDQLLKPLVISNIGTPFLTKYLSSTNDCLNTFLKKAATELTQWLDDLTLQKVQELLRSNKNSKVNVTRLSSKPKSKLIDAIVKNLKLVRF